MKSPLWRVNDFDPSKKTGRSILWKATGLARIDLPLQTERCPNAVILGASMTGISLSRPGPTVVGFTGHRRVKNEKALAQVLREVIATLQQDVGRDLVGRSSIASGADTLFAEACLASNMKWIAQLPFPEAEFKKDFKEADWKRAQALLDRAERIEISSEIAERPRSYLDCGLATVDGADLMVAVWDGKAPRGQGGTAQIIEHTRALQKPLILISPDGVKINRERFRENK